MKSSRKGGGQQGGGHTSCGNPKRETNREVPMKVGRKGGGQQGGEPVSYIQPTLTTKREGQNHSRYNTVIKKQTCTICITYTN